MELALSWEGTGGAFPAEVGRAIGTSPALADLEPLFVMPEYQVPLVGGRRPSQTDALVIARGARAGLAVMAVEGKAGEDFGKPLGEWRRDASEGKTARERQLADALHLKTLPDDVRYQLVHRTASATIEARRFGARHAIMLVQTFPTDSDHFEDFRRFVGLFDATAPRHGIVALWDHDGMTLWAGWVESPASP